MNAPAMLASPCPINSWLGSKRCPVLAAIAFAMEMASMNPSSDITIAIGKRRAMSAHLMLGVLKVGKPALMFPTTAPPPKKTRDCVSNDPAPIDKRHFSGRVLEFSGALPSEKNTNVPSDSSTAVR